MPHAGRDDTRYLANTCDAADPEMRGRSDGYQCGRNYDYQNAAQGRSNGNDGHMCLHFYGSTRHNDGGTDVKHQSQIEKVAKMMTTSYGSTCGGVFDSLCL